MTFTLKIETGNEAMQTYGDIARALRKVADKLHDDGGEVFASSGGIMDDNGNRVGEWKAEGEPGECEHEYMWSRSCGARVCTQCDDHQGLARCYCGWSRSGGNGRAELEEMGERIEPEE